MPHGSYLTPETSIATPVGILAGLAQRALLPVDGSWLTNFLLQGVTTVFWALVAAVAVHYLRKYLKGKGGEGD